MTGYADLEIGLHRRDAENYGVELRFIHPDGDADVRLLGAAPSTQLVMPAIWRSRSTSGWMR